jgi:hypothetical protein
MSLPNKPIVTILSILLFQLSRIETVNIRLFLLFLPCNLTGYEENIFFFFLSLFKIIVAFKIIILKFNSDLSHI